MELILVIMMIVTKPHILEEIFQIQQEDLSGAGDTFMAALAVKYTETGDIDSSITYANSCASQVVKKRGTTVV